MNLETVVNYLKTTKVGSDIHFEHQFENRSGAYQNAHIIESDIIREAIHDMGIEQLYAHQAEAYEKVRAGKNIIVTTPTASGKTLCYNLPIIEEMYHDRNVCALYLFPMKALGVDQRHTIEKFLSYIPLGEGVSVAIIDGDTDKKTRRKILKDPPNIIISNVDILHYSILSKRTEWGTFLNRLKYIVLDEMHSYRGVFGSHVHNLFARFNRLYPNVQYIACSATIGNPVEFPQQLLGQTFHHIDENGAPSGRKFFQLINPEIPAAGVASFLIKLFLDSGIKTLCFTKSRKQTETIFSRIVRSDEGYRKRVSSYRAGFLPEERREIEQQFHDGDLSAVISTSAFELGMDIGGIDATILVGYPGSLMSLWQRAGRAGRNQEDSLIIFVAGNDALDQYYCKHPKELIDSQFEVLSVDTDNDEINKSHVSCAAYEQPITLSEPYAEQHAALLKEMIHQSKLFEDVAGEKLITLHQYPYGDINLRSAGDTYVILSDGILLGSNSSRRVYTECYEGAIYLHRGNSFEVTKVDSAKREIHVKPSNANYFTVAKMDKQTIVLNQIEQITDGNIQAAFVEVQVSEQLTGYEKISNTSGEKIQTVELKKEPIQYVTKGFYLLIPDEIKQDTTDFMGSIHAMEHSMIAMIPTFILCDRMDIAGISYPMHPQLQQSAIFIYDGFPGGIGLTKRMFGDMRPLLNRTARHVSECDCESGCPACIYSPKCGSGNYPLNKKGAVDIPTVILSDSPIISPPLAPTMITNSISEFDRNDILVFDLETQKSADDVGGWNNAHLMGVSVGVVYSMVHDTFHVYTENEMETLISQLEHAKMIIGFNIINFDIKVLSGYRSMNLKEVLTFDLLQDIRHQTGRRISLENLAVPTLKVGKSADGLQALKWYKEGKIDEITHYCKQDVQVTTDLLRFGMENGYVLGAVKGAMVKIPVNWKDVI